MTKMEKVSASFAWRTHLGGMQSRSRILDGGDVLFVGTCGDAWNVRDRADGVHCISKLTGQSLWFTATLADVNEMALAGPDLLVPTDIGDLLVIDVTTGAIKTIYRVDSSVLGQPLIYRNGTRWSALFASIAGTIYSIDSNDDQLLEIGTISGGVRASLVPTGPQGFLAATETGLVVRASMKRNDLQCEILAEAPRGTYGGGTSITATPLIRGDLAFVGYARDTYDAQPAVFCLNWRSGEVVWSAEGNVDDTYGNVRTTPAVVGDRLAVASSYSDSVLFIDPASGSYLGEVKLGQSVFQQWSSPVLVGPDVVALGRVDGVVSLIDAQSLKLLTSISLQTAGAETLTRLHSGGGDEVFGLYPGEPAPAGAICGTPLSSNNKLYVGTTDGILGAISVGW